VAGQALGEHTGYLTPFEAALDTATVEDCCCGSECTVEVTLDGGRPCDKGGCADALMGAADDDTDGTGLGGWAGLNGHVSIECRPPIFIDGGVGNIVPPHVQHPPVTTSSAGEPLERSVGVRDIARAPPQPARINLLSRRPALNLTSAWLPAARR
jgi:hypothetical protein